MAGSILVKLPAESTVHLPQATAARFGYFTEMLDLAAVLKAIDRDIAAHNATVPKDEQWTDEIVARLAGHPYAISNIRKTVRNGRGSRPKAETLTALAKVLPSVQAALAGQAWGIADDDELRAIRDRLKADLDAVDRVIALREAARRAG